MTTKQRVQNFVDYLFDKGVVSSNESLGTLRSNIYDAVKQVFGKNALSQVDLITTVNKVLSRRGVIRWG